MSNGKARNTKTLVDNIVEMKREQKKQYGLSRKQASGVVSTSSSGGNRSGNTNANITSGYLRTGGDTMIGPIAFYPQSVNVVNGVIDISESTGKFSSRIEVLGQGNVADNLDTISGTKYSGQILFLQAVSTTPITLKHLTPLTGNIYSPTGSDVVVAGKEIVLLQWDTSNEAYGGSYGQWTIVSKINQAISPTTEFVDNVFKIKDDIDPTRTLQFQVGGIAASTNKTVTVQNANGTMALLDGDDGANQIFSNNIRLNSSVLELNNNYISSTTDAISTSSGFLRMTNNQIGIAWRDHLGTGNVEVKVDNTTSYFDITKSNNQVAGLRVRTQHAVDPDNSFGLEQGSGSGGTSTLFFPDNLWLERNGTPKFRIIDANEIRFWDDVDNFSIWRNGTGVINIGGVSDLIFFGYSGNGMDISRNASTGLRYSLEDNNRSHLFRIGGSGLTNVFEITQAEVKMYSPLSFVPSADGTLDIGSDLLSFSSVYADRLILKHNDGVSSTDPSIGRSSNTLRLNTPTGNSIQFDVNGTNEAYINNLGLYLKNLNSMIFLDGADLQKLSMNYITGTGGVIETAENTVENLRYISNATTPAFLLLGKNTASGQTAQSLEFWGRSNTSQNRAYGRILVAQDSSSNLSEFGTIEFSIIENGAPYTDIMVMDTLSITPYRSIVFGTGATRLDMGNRYVEFDVMSAPSHTTATKRYLFQDSSDDHLKIRTNSGLIDLESPSTSNAISQGDSNVTVTDTGTGGINVVVDAQTIQSYSAGSTGIYKTLIFSGAGINMNGQNITNIAQCNMSNIGSDPTSNGQIRLNGNDVKVYSGGAVRNISNVGESAGYRAYRTTSDVDSWHLLQVFTSDISSDFKVSGNGPADYRNIVYFVPYVPTKNITVKFLGCIISTVGTASGRVDMGIYSSDANMKPEILLSTSQVTGFTTGLKKINIPDIVLTAGTLYYIAFKANDSLNGFDFHYMLGWALQPINQLESLLDTAGNIATTYGWSYTYSSTGLQGDVSAANLTRRGNNFNVPAMLIRT